MKQVEFKQLSDLSVEEILSLPRATLKVAQEVNSYNNTIRFNAYLDLLDGKLEIRFPIDRAVFFVISKYRNKDSSKGNYVVSFPYRIVKCTGFRKDNHQEYIYYYVEGYACPKEKKVYLNQFLKGSQADLLDCYPIEGIIDRGAVSNSEGESVGYFDDLA